MIPFSCVYLNIVDSAYNNHEFPLVKVIRDHERDLGNKQKEGYYGQTNKALERKSQT